MLQRLSKVLLLLFSGWLLAGPLAFLQLGAWGWMLASYSQDSSFEQAVVETFGNERPCNLCRVIDAVQEEESTSDRAQVTPAKDLKLMLGLGRAVKISAPRASAESKTQRVDTPEKVQWEVPTPPPKVA